MEALDWKAAFDARNERWQLIPHGEHLGFSWSQCDTCGSKLGGDRYLVRRNWDGEWDTMESCTDCISHLSGTEPFSF